MKSQENRKLVMVMRGEKTRIVRYRCRRKAIDYIAGPMLDRGEVSSHEAATMCFNLGAREAAEAFKK